MVAFLAAGAVFVAIMMLARGAGSPQMSLLYGGLESQAAGDVLTALDAQNVSYEVQGRGIYVPAGQRDSLRMSLAAEDLPANSAKGYELLDGLSGFGTTSQMFDAAYWRAREGELARTILSSPHIRAARVHISAPSSRPFARESRASASVTVTTADGALSPGFAKALRYLVASAVPGMSPEDVAVIDGNGGLISPDDEAGGNQAGRAEELQARAERLLDARVGHGNAIVEVSVETVTETEQVTERTIDPDSRIAISTEVEERSTASQDSQGGQVTVASNLPDGAADGDGQSQSENSETRQLTNYDMSERGRVITRGPGAIKRISVAVLVNDQMITADDGTQSRQPRSEEELAALSALVSSAVGLDTGRGDVITVRSMQFLPAPVLGTEAVALPGTALDTMMLIQLAVLAAVALVLGLFVVRPILLPRGGGAGADGGLIGLPGPASAMAPAASDLDTVLDTEAGASRPALSDLSGAQDGPDPVTRLRQMIEERQDETLQILQSWIEDPEPNARS